MCLLIIIFTPYIFMAGYMCCLLFQLEFIKPFVEYLFYYPVAVLTQTMGTPAGIYQPFIAYTPGEAQYTGTGLISLFRVCLFFQYFGYILCYIFMDIHTLCYELLTRPFSQELVLGGKVFRVGCILVFTPVTYVLGYEFMLVIDFLPIGMYKAP